MQHTCTLTVNLLNVVKPKNRIQGGICVIGVNNNNNNNQAGGNNNNQAGGANNNNNQGGGGNMDQGWLDIGTQQRANDIPLRVNECTSNNNLWWSHNNIT